VYALVQPLGLGGPHLGPSIDLRDPQLPPLLLLLLDPLLPDLPDEDELDDQDAL